MDVKICSCGCYGCAMIKFPDAFRSVPVELDLFRDVGFDLVFADDG
jgi:hypothetical protein